eukprot:2095267-Rhodomonas_salina.1
MGGGRCHDGLAIRRGRLALRESRAPRVPAGSPLHHCPRVELKPCPPVEVETLWRVRPRCGGSPG